MTKYSIPTRKTMRGAVLDSPSKGKMTETSVAEGTMSVVQPTPRTSRASGHLSIFYVLPNKGIASNKDLMKIEHWVHAIT